MIKVSELGKKFDSVVAVNNVSFECEKGEIFGLLGANGAGKTTTARMLCTLLKPTSGTAKINGYDIITEGQQVRKSIGVLSGETGLYHRLTAEENVEYFGKLYGLEAKYIKQRIELLFSLLEMDEYRNRRTGDFSKGMKQKVNIVRAVLHDPPVLLFDEPTAGLDVMSSRSVLEFIAKCKQEGKCILFSTHIMTEAEKLCDRIAIIDRGCLVAQGTVQELLDKTGQNTLEEAFVRLVGGPHATGY